MFADWQATLSKSLRVVAFVIAVPLLATTAQAAILDASWTAPTTNVDGTPLTDLASYRVYYGTSPTPCPGTSFVQVPSATPSPAPNTTVNHRLTGLASGTTYFVSVTAVDTSGNESACLSPAQSAVARLEFSVSPSGTIAFGNVAIGSTADQTVTVQNTAGGTVTGTITTSAPFSVVSGASFTLTGTGATHTATVRFAPVVAAAVTANLTVSAGGSSVSRVLSGTGLADATAPTVAITTPTSAGTFTTTSASINIGGTASDNIAVTQVTWTNNRGGSGTATGTTNWSAAGITLQPGTNVLTVTARDAANNTATATLTVTFTDTTAPTVTITAPTTAATFTTSSASINLAGTASDNVGVTQVSWSNNRGGGGTATGTGNWTVTGAALQPGANVLTVTARDAANNTASATLTVTFTDTTAPTVTLTAPAAGATVGGTLTVTAGATDNVGVVGVQFRLDGANLGAEVTAPPFAVSWNTTASVNGSHSLTAAARDAAGNTATSAAVVVTVSNVAPPVISGVTVSGITSTSATISWTTDTLSDTQVEFGPTTAYGSTAGTVTLVTSHMQTLNGLAPNTTYQFRVKSRDAVGNLSTSGNFSFTTLPDASTGLLAHWMFNDGRGTSAADSSGNGHTGTLSSGASWTPGIMQQALALDGQAGFVSVPHADALNAYPISISGWIRTSSTTGTRGILNKLVPGVANGYRFFMSDGNLCAEYFRSAAAFVSDGTACALAAAGYADGQWHHVVFVVDALGGRIYVDGVQRASRGWTGTSGAPNSGQPITIGDDGGTSGFFAGTIDDLRIYGRALSAGEVSGLYGSVGGGGGGTGAPTVSGVAVTAVNQTSATVVWSTNIPSDSQVEFGTSAAYGATTPLDTAFVTLHSRMLTGLQPGTMYHFRVRSRDAAGNLAVSGDATFRTPDMVRVVQQQQRKKSNKNWFDDFLDLFLK
jgi:hypothetical protein